MHSTLDPFVHAIDAAFDAAHDDVADFDDDDDPATTLLEYLSSARDDAPPPPPGRRGRMVSLIVERPPLA
jgi:hypothetical protein